MTRALLALAVFAALAAVPAFADNAMLTLVARAMIFALAAVSLGFILGQGGLVSFGHAATMGIGAYAVGILMEEGVRDALVAFPWPWRRPACSRSSPGRSRCARGASISS